MLILSSIQRVKKIKVFELIKLILMMCKPISLGEASKSGVRYRGTRMDKCIDMDIPMHAYA